MYGMKHENIEELQKKKKGERNLTTLPVQHRSSHWKEERSNIIGSLTALPTATSSINNCNIIPGCCGCNHSINNRAKVDHQNTMAAATQASSRLELLQARFQQKQLQEKEEKLLRLYGTSSNGTVNRVSVVKSTANGRTTMKQGGKVRQMFDERRQTTVKGIDRSYPLEPLECKPKKKLEYGNSHFEISLKNQLTGRNDTNENYNKRSDEFEDDKLKENIRTNFNGSYIEITEEDRNGHEKNGIDDDTIERNRMLAKIHLMEFDVSMKHRIKNDLESEEFPEDLMVDVPDKLTKKNNMTVNNFSNINTTSKVSQAEERLKRFRTLNARKSKNSISNGDNNNSYSNKREPTSNKISPVRSSSVTKSKVHSSPGEVRKDSPSPPPQKFSARKGKSATVNTRVQESKRNSVPRFENTNNGNNCNTNDRGSNLGSPMSTPSKTSARSSGGTSSSAGTAGMSAKMSTKTKAPAKPGSASKSGGSSGSFSDGLSPCKICGRRFAPDRITLHQKICAKTGQKKRKQFDAMAFRVKGTELEPFVKRGAGKTSEPKNKKPNPKSNWRRKHEDFINAIRSAKQVQAHLAAGGKLSDLPPPPPSDTSDYIQCPHCGRKFNENAAERHIPKCQNMLHNKPTAKVPIRPRR